MRSESVIDVFPGENALRDAFLRLPPEDGTRAVLRLAPGVYREKLVLSRANTTLEGAGADSTRIVWGDGAFEPLPDGQKRGTFRTATLRVDAKNVVLRGLTVQNDAAPRERVGQAIALYADGDGFLCEDCALTGAQDTLFTAPLPPKEIVKDGFAGPKQYAPREPQRQTYRRCRITGDVDFIFGGAAAWFEDCDIVSIDGSKNPTAPFEGYATAASTPQGQRFGYVFSRCRFLSDGCPRASAYLGRPWRDYAKTVLLGCEIGAHISPDLFHDWNKPHAREACLYALHGCYGSGMSETPAGFVRLLTDEEAAPYTYEAFCADALKTTV